MKHPPLFLFILFSGIIISSCSEKSNLTTQTAKVYEWSVVDSLDLDYLGNPMLSAVNQRGSKLLFFDYTSSKILTTDPQGTIIHSFSKEEDTPDSYGYLMERPGFYGDDQVAIYGRLGMFLFTLDGEMLKKIPHPESLGASGSVINIGKSTESIIIQDKEYLLPTSVRPRNSYPGEQEFYDTYRAVELIDVENESMTELIPFEKGSHFLNGKGFIHSDYSPAYEAKNGKLYFVHGGDPQLYVYKVSPEEALLDTVIQLNVPGIFIPDGKDRAEFQQGHVEIQGGNASIRNIHILNDKLLLDFYAGQDPVKAEQAEAIWQGGNEEEAKTLYMKLEEDTPKGTLLYDLTDLSFLGIISPPGKTGGRSYASGGGYAWFQKLPDPEVEEDFLRIYKMKLVEK